MPDLADLYPDFESRWIDTTAGKLFCRVGGKGAPLLLIHGYPQTNVMWHRVAPALSERFTLVIPDLPGYGWSQVPQPSPDHAPYDKRSMANAMVELMEQIGHIRFRLAGHDRGGRVAYRLALDHPERVEKVAVLDIVPTYEMWAGMDKTLAVKAWHWLFMAQREPLPEMLIKGAPTPFQDWVMSSWTKAKNLSAFDARALSHYRAFFQSPDRIHAACEDYRAGHRIDPEHDTADKEAGRKIAAPLLALWGETGIVAERSPLDTWRDWATKVSGQPIDSGHFLAEENPTATAAALLAFFGR
jgi:haloacetate dehalogenase